MISPCSFQCFSQISHDISLIFSWCSHDFPCMIFPCFFFQMFLQDFPMISQWFSHVLLRFPMVSPWRDFPVFFLPIFPCLSQIWYPHDFPHMFSFFSMISLISPCFFLFQCFSNIFHDVRYDFPTGVPIMCPIVSQSSLWYPNDLSGGFFHGFQSHGILRFPHDVSPMIFPMIFPMVITPNPSLPSRPSTVRPSAARPPYARRAWPHPHRGRSCSRRCWRWDNEDRGNGAGGCSIWFHGDHHNPQEIAVWDR